MKQIKTLYTFTAACCIVLAQKYFTEVNRLTAFELTLIVLNAYFIGTLNR